MPEETPPNSSLRPATRGTKPRPRTGIQRKTLAEREQFAKEEAERQKTRAAENASVRGLARGGRDGRGGRGAATTGQSQERARDGPIGGGGVFGAGSGLRPGGKSKSSLPAGYSELLEGHQPADAGETLRSVAAKETATDVNDGGTSSGKSAAPKKGDVVDIITDEEPDEIPKRDIEQIWISSNEEEDIATSSKRKQKATPRLARAGIGLRPVRAPRTLKEEEADTAASRRKPRALKKNDSEIYSLDDDVMEVDEPVHLVKEQPSSPEMRRRSLKKQASKGVRDPKFAAAETIEERTERLRVVDDVQKLKDLFVGGQTMRNTAVEDAEAMEASLDSLDDGKLFLFQLPPLTPFLIDPSAIPEEPEVKVEQSGDTRTATIPTTTIDATTGSEVKKDPDAPATKTGKRGPEFDGLLTASEPQRLPSGIVGKLRVHKSGKVSLDWGGTDMEVRWGSEVGFLQDVVLVKSGDEHKGENGAGDDREEDEDDVVGGRRTTDGATKAQGVGKTYALGQVRKKLVLVPDWVKLYD